MKVWSAEAGDAAHRLVVLIHGAMDRSASMLKLSRRLDHRFRVLRYDRRGYGHSVQHNGPFDMESQVADLVELLDGRQAVIVGHSYGGNVALATAARSELVAGVVIYESPLPWEPFWPPPQALVGARRGRGLSPEATADAAEAFMRRLIGDDRWMALPERTRLSRRSEGLALVSELKDIRDHRPWDAVDVKVPVMVGVGSRAGERYQHGMAYVADQIGGAKLVQLQGCGHDAPTAAPEKFCSELIEPLLQQLED